MNSTSNHAARFSELVDGCGLTNKLHDYHYISGLLLALVSAPDVVSPSEWLPLIYREDEEPGLPDQESLQHLLDALMTLWNQWAGETENPQQPISLPEGCGLIEDTPTPALTSFSQGLVHGYGWLQDDWEHFFDVMEESEELEEMESIFGTTLACAMFLAEPEAARRAMEAEGDEPIPPREALEILPEGLTILATLGRAASSIDEDEED